MRKLKHLKQTLFLLATAATIFTSKNLSAETGPTGENEEVSKDKRYFQVVLIWVKDPAKFQEYGSLMGPIVSKYGGAGERIISPVSSFYGGETGKALEAPHMVNIVYYDSKEAYEQFTNDPEFLKIVHLRDESIEMAGISGEVINGELLPGQVENRLYMIELAYFNESSGKDYNKYERQSASYYNKHKLRTERTLKPDDVFGGIKMPDKVIIKYLENESDRPAMEADKDHARIEQMYGEAISDLIWIEGKAAFVNMQ